LIKKGFTLVELLGVFAIMAIIMLVSVPIITGMMKKGEEQKYITFKNNAFLSAEAYINDHIEDYPEMKTVGSYVYITFKQLIENNYMSSTVYDPNTSKTADEELDYTVVATVLSNYTYSYSLSTVKLVKDLVVPTIDSLTVNGKVATFTINDNYELQGYYVSTTTDIPSLWNTTGSVITYTNSYTALTAGTYYLHVIDYKGNTSYSSFIILPSAFCAYATGQTWNFAYTGGIQNFTVPCDGTYKLETWGAQGGYIGGTGGGLGGYSIGNASLITNQTLYVVVGGAGTSNSSNSANGTFPGGYNGGGQGISNSTVSGNGNNSGGGGATHIAKITGTLGSIGYTSGVTNGNILIVSGGGGGSAYDNAYGAKVGGTGGGTTGGDGAYATYAGYGGTAATQTSAGGGGSFGIGGSASSSGTGGGGGLYGGGAAAYYCGGGGGSGYLSSTLTSASMTSGSRGGSGAATITLVSLN